MKITCPNCKSQMKIPDRYLGKRAHCPKCKLLLQIPENPEGKAKLAYGE
ncbi:hypothetical protein ACFL4W_02090 [Planctomycetota bacterium]